MFDLDKWQEIYETIRKNKMRTFLTGFSVSWGIFMLVILLGSGNGLENGVREQFKGSANNTVWVNSGMTSVAYKGLKAGREIKMNNEDYKLISDLFSTKIDHISGRLWIGSTVVSYKNETGAFNVQPCHPDLGYIREIELVKGRFLNKIDLKEDRKSAVISRLVQQTIFKGKDTAAIGSYIKINGVAFQVVGVFANRAKNQDEGRRIYIPIYAAQKIFNGANRLDQISFTTGDANLAESEKMVETVKQQLSRLHSFDPNDKKALNIWSKAQEFTKVMNLFLGIRIFIWIIGIMTIIAGVVGVSNIMLVVVKERTKEIGIRKAIGASSWSIISLILQEATLITTIAGYFGLVAGVGVLELMRKFIPPSPFFMNPQANFTIAVLATVVLIMAGILAGFVPALNATRIKPVDALRDE